MPEHRKWIRLVGAMALVPAVLAAQSPASAKTWVGREAEIEEYLRTAPVTRTEDVPRGVTRPQRAYFAPGGAVDSMVWKPLRPGMSRGYYESYKSEIAAYEIDKLLALAMVPPKVERHMEKDAGVAVMWIAPTKSFADLGGVPKPPPAQAAAWNRQVVKAKMFQNLIGDIDPNLGNWLVDPAWNLILVDQSRALTTKTKLVHEMQSIDADLWTRIQQLTEGTLTTAVGTWIGKREIGAILERREKMQAQIDKLVRARGEAQVFIRVPQAANEPTPERHPTVTAATLRSSITEMCAPVSRASCVQRMESASGLP
jgi:hypothetical protein